MPDNSLTAAFKLPSYFSLAKSSKFLKKGIFSPGITLFLVPLCGLPVIIGFSTHALFSNCFLSAFTAFLVHLLLAWYIVSCSAISKSFCHFGSKGSFGGLGSLSLKDPDQSICSSLTISLLGSSFFFLKETNSLILSTPCSAASTIPGFSLIYLLAASPAIPRVVATNPIV